MPLILNLPRRDGEIPMLKWNVCCRIKRSMKNNDKSIGKKITVF